MTDKLWGARFTQDITPDVLQYTLTLDVDVRLVPFDLWQDIAHTLMLGHRDVIPVESARAIVETLVELYQRNLSGQLVLDPQYEDVHLNIEQMVIAKLGLGIGGRMHTARSRNDQVSTDTRMYLRQVQIDAMESTLDLVEELLQVDEPDYLTILPGYTHSQAAQPISVAFWRTAHASMLLRDVARLRDVYARTNESPLGACALAGTSFDLDRSLTARLLGFDRILTHSLDATSARDYLIETAAAFAISSNTMSRMAEEIVIWSGHEHRLCDVGDEFATGSSIMPQKKNPVVAELVRSRTGRTVGTLVQLLTAVKGVPLGYSCDLQEDKPYLWKSIDTHLFTLRILTAQTRALRFDFKRGEQLCWDNFSTATELANYLVRERGVAFRESHHIVGSLVVALLSRGGTLRDIALVNAILAGLGHQVDNEVLQYLLAPRTALAGSTSVGGTAPVSVRQILGELTCAASEHRAWSQARAETLRVAQQVTLSASRRFAAGAALDKTLEAGVAELASI
jgi:argininosuccinate lyase